MYDLVSRISKPNRRAVLTGVGGALLSSTASLTWAHTESSPGQHARYTDRFERAYIQGAIQPFMQTSIYNAGPLSVPMIDVAFSKEGAIPPHLWGMLYDGWLPAMEEEGLSVFIQGLENRGDANARKRIYMSAITPDLTATRYRPKIRRFLETLFSEENAGAPLMERYYDGYWDLYWDLHLGAHGDDIPDEVREIGQRFNAVIGFWDPREEIVYDNYMRVRELRPTLRRWIDERVQMVVDGAIDEPEATFVHYWAINGDFGPDFRRKDVVFECFHNFLAFSQWGNTLYRVMGVLAEEGGDEVVRAAYRQTLAGNGVSSDRVGFDALDRLVMELYRTISPNTGSVSTVAETRVGVTGMSFLIHPHPETSRASRHWESPNAFNPDRYTDAVAAHEVDDAHCEALGFSRCPFSGASLEVQDGRRVTLPSSGFGTVHAIVDGRPAPLIDEAGFAPFGFGYRRCAGEWLSIDFVREALLVAWERELRFHRHDADDATRLPVGPVVVINDDIGFTRG